MNDHGESLTSGCLNVMSIISNSKNKTSKKSKKKNKNADWPRKKALCIKAQEHPNFTLEASNRVRNKT